MAENRPMLARGTEFQLSAGGTGFVGPYIGGGGQGAVYIADCGGRKLALKWYHDNVVALDTTLRSRIAGMIRKGSPDRNFVWPLALAEIAGKSGFGYLMPLISSDMRQLSDMFAPEPKHFNPGLAVRATACLAIATSFQKLHATGYCYQDINFGGFFIDPERGTIQICDADNVAVDGIAGGVYGTRKFMAPEVLRREEIPSTRTDLYSMAVLFFYLIFNWHPLDGKRENAIVAVGSADEMDLYGRNPLFLFDPANSSNGPVPKLHDWIVARWQAVPQAMRALFTRIFTTGLMHPATRPLENEWRNMFDHLREAVVPCPACGFEHGVDRALVQNGLHCVACKGLIAVPPLLSAAHEPLLLRAKRAILEYQLDSGFVIDDCPCIAIVQPHPTDFAILGLQNTRATPWMAQLPGGAPLQIAPGKTVRIIDGLAILVGERHAIVSMLQVANGP